jgi:signal transduction histidine kinase
MTSIMRGATGYRKVNLISDIPVTSGIITPSDWLSKLRKTEKTRLGTYKDKGKDKDKSLIARRNAQFRAIAAVATAIGKQTDSKQPGSEQSGLIPVLNQAIDAVLEVTELSCGFAHLMDEEGASLVLAAHRGGKGPVEAVERFCLDEGMIGRAAEAGELLIAPDLASDGLIGAMIAVPLIARGRVCGVLSFCEAEPRRFSDDEEEMLRVIGWQLGVALEQSHLLEEVDKSHREWEQIERRLIHQERISAVGELAAGIAHEIGTPLNIISANVEYLLRQKHSWSAGESPAPGADSELIAIRDQVHNITRLIRQLLNFARDQSPAFAPLDVNELIERTLELLVHRLNQARIHCQTSLALDAPSVNGDAVQLQQVLFNLIANARQAIEENEQESGLIRISTVSSPVPTDECSRPHVIITIADDGPGIPHELLPQVFKPFFTANKEGGTGLGLSICQQIVQRHFGSITIDNSRPHGAIVKIYLPLIL